MQRHRKFTTRPNIGRKRLAIAVRQSGYLAFFIVTSVLRADTVQAQWALRVGGTNTEEGFGLGVTQTDDVIVAGEFSCRSTTDPSDICDFDPSEASEALLSNGSGFVARYSSSGAFEWVRELSAPARDVGLDREGNVYVATSDCSVSKYSGDGAEMWSRSVAEGSRCDAVALSSAGELFVAGDGPFVARLKRDTGELVWSYTAGGQARTVGLGADADGNVTAFGTFEEPFDADPGNGEEIVPGNGSADLFLLSLEREGDFRWALGLGGSEPEEGGDLAVGADGSVYITGRFGASVDFGSGPTEAGDRIWASFLAKYDSHGRHIWSRTATSGSGRSVSVRDTHVVVAGVFGTDVNFDPDRSAQADLMAAGHTDVYVARFDLEGLYQSGFRLGGKADEWVNSVVVDSRASIFLTGKFWSVADFDPGPGVYELDARGPSGRGDLPDLFLVKYSVGGGFALASQRPNGSGPRFSLSAPFPNPAAAYSTLTVVVDRPQWAAIRLYDPLGRQVQAARSHYLEPGRQSLRVPLAGLAAGLYLVAVQSEAGIATRKILVP